MLLPQLPHLPKFLDFSPDDDGFTCIFPLSRAQFRRCRKTVNKKDRQSAILLREEICASDPSEDGIETYLQSYAQLCCCTQYHRAEVNDPPLLKQLSNQWKKQLRFGAAIDSQEAGRIAATHADHLEPVPKDEVDEAECSMHRNATTPKNSQRVTQRPTPDSHKSSPPEDAGSKDDRQIANTRPQKTNTRALNLYQSQAKPATVAEVPVKTVITRSQTGSLPWAFTPRRPPAEKTMLKLLTDPISEYSSQVGLIYLYTRWSNPGYIKLGCTTRHEQVRLNEWAKSCGYKPILLYTTGPIPNVRRLESLLKKDLSLQGRGRQETYCKHNKHCSKNHIEWFEVSLAEALLLVDNWVTWMRDASPYRCMVKANHKNPPVVVIREEWRQYFQSLSQRKIKIRSQFLQVDIRSQKIAVGPDQPTCVPKSADEEADPEDYVPETKAIRRQLVQGSANIPRIANPLPPCRDNRVDTDNEALKRSGSSQMVDRGSLDPKLAAAFALAASALCKTFGVNQTALSTIFDAGSLSDSIRGVGGTNSRSLDLDMKPLPQIMTC
jgi:hypothetical protein